MYLGRSDIPDRKVTLLEAYIMEVTFKCDVKIFVSLSFPALSNVYEEKSLLLAS